MPLFTDNIYMLLGIGFTRTRIFYSRRFCAGGPRSLPVGAEVIVRNSQASSYEKAIKEWAVVPNGLTYAPGGEKDAFGNYPHYIFRIVNRKTGIVLLLGRNDIQSHGMLSRNGVKVAIKDKNQELKSYKSKLPLVRKYSKFYELNESEEALLSKEKIGDAEYAEIEALYLKSEEVLKTRGYDFEKEAKYQELFEVYEALDKAGFKEFYFTKEEIDLLDTLYFKWGEAESLLERKEVEALDFIHKKVYDLQYALRTSGALWAQGKVKETYRFAECMQAAVAWQANLYVANLFAEKILNSEIKDVIDLGAGASPLYQILKHIGALPQGVLLDVESDITASHKACNPLRIRGSVTALSVQNASFDLATSVFVYTHLNYKQRKMAIAEGLRVLRKDGEMIIVMPESYKFSKKMMRGVIALGGEIISVESPKPNKLTEEERAECKEKYGVEVLRIVGSLLGKKFNLLRVKKAAQITQDELEAVNPKLFVFIRDGKSRKSMGIRKSGEDSLRSDYLLALAYASMELDPKKISTTAIEYLPVEAIEEQYPGFGDKYMDLRYLDPILERRIIKRLNEIEISCNELRGVDKADVEWMVRLHARITINKVNASEFRALFPEVERWRQGQDFFGLKIEGVRIKAIFDYPEEQRGRRFYVESVLNIARNSYAQALGISVRRLQLELSEEELNTIGLRLVQVASMIGCSHSAIGKALNREGDNRLAPYILSQVQVGDKIRVMFDEAKVRKDLELLKEAFGLGGGRLPPQAGEISTTEIAALIGISKTLILNALNNPQDNRLSPYLSETQRFAKNQPVYVFVASKVMRDLASLREAFGRGGERLPIKKGEITLVVLAKLIGISRDSLERELQKGTEGIIHPYLLPHTRVVSGGDVRVFDRAVVQRDLEKIKEAFGKGGDRLPPQDGELTTGELKSLIGCSKGTIQNELAKKNEGKLGPYLLPHTRVVSGKDVRVFDRAAVQRDLEKIKEAFGKGGDRLPPQDGELTTGQLRRLIGCSNSTIQKELSKENGGRLGPYLLPHTRIIARKSARVFDENAVMGDLAQLKRAFGRVDGLRLAQVASMIGCSHGTIRGSLNREGDNRLSPYILSQVQVGDKTRIIFDGSKIAEDLALLKEAFGLGGERLPPQEGEISTTEVADLIGVGRTAIFNALNNPQDNRLSPYLSETQRFAKNQPVNVFVASKIMRDLASLREAFGRGGERLPIKKGEITLVVLAKLIGIARKSLQGELKKENRGILGPYLFPHTRVVTGRDVIVFDEAAVQRDLEKIKEALGKGGDRLPPQDGELTTGQLRRLIGCSKPTIRRELSKENGGILGPYLLPHTRIIARRSARVFDETEVMRDLAKLKRAFGKT